MRSLRLIVPGFFLMTLLLTSAAFAQSVFAGFGEPSAVTSPADVAQAVWRAANDDSDQLRFPAGPDAVALAKAC